MFEIRMFKLNSCPRNLILLTELLANKLKSENLQIWKLSKSPAILKAQKGRPRFDVLVKAPFLKSYLEGKNVEFLICNKMNLLLIILDLSIIYLH